MKYLKILKTKETQLLLISHQFALKTKKCLSLTKLIQDLSKNLGN